MAELMKAILHSACHVIGYSKDESPSPAAAAGCKTAVTPPPLKPTTAEFRMPLHYPRYSKKDYEGMEEWRLDLLFSQYGLRFDGSLAEKRAYAIGTFLWPDQY